MEEIAEILKINVKMAQVVIGPLLGIGIRMEGKTRGARYFIV
jgi:hypothetical protein